MQGDRTGILSTPGPGVSYMGSIDTQVRLEYQLVKAQ